MTYKAEAEAFEEIFRIKFVVECEDGACCCCCLLLLLLLLLLLEQQLSVQASCSSSREGPPLGVLMEAQERSQTMKLRERRKQQQPITRCICL